MYVGDKGAYGEEYGNKEVLGGFTGKEGVSFFSCGIFMWPWVLRGDGGYCVVEGFGRLEESVWADRAEVWTAGVQSG